MDNGNLTQMTGSISNIVIKYGYIGFGFINGDDGISYYFDNRSLKEDNLLIDGCKIFDEVTFWTDGQIDDKGRGRAQKVEIIEDTLLNVRTEELISDEVNEKHGTDEDSDGIDDAGKEDFDGYITFFKAGFPRKFNKENLNNHLKNKDELDVIEKLSKVLWISKVNYHDMGIGARTYEFCIAGTTRCLRKYIRGRYEFLIVLSHFPSRQWQEVSLAAEREIRKRGEIRDRHLRVNFYVLISNATNLFERVDEKRGDSTANIIPFSFEELLAIDERKLEGLIEDRFEKYYYENNMLGETNIIDDDNLLFGNRKQVADLIVERCLRNTNSGIFGLRRSGKSSVLHAVIRRLNKFGVKHVLVESTRLTSGDWNEALYNIAKSIRIEMLEAKQSEGESREEFEFRLKLNSTVEDYTENAQEFFIEDVKHYTSEVENFVIAIDEIERILCNTTASPKWKSLDAHVNFWGALRDCGCSLIVCGVNSTINERSMMEVNGIEGDNPMYGRLEDIDKATGAYLAPFTAEQTKEMLNVLGGYSNVAFDEVYQDIWSIFGGQPFAMRQFSSYLFEKVKDQREKGKLYQIKRAAVQRYYQQYIDSQEGVNLCQQILQYIRVFETEYKTLNQIALVAKGDREIYGKEIQNIDHLKKYGLLEYDESTGSVIFKQEIIEEYLLRVNEKDPKMMSEREYRQYVQDKIEYCETQMKKYIYGYYLYSGKPEVLRKYFYEGIQDGRSSLEKIDRNSDPMKCDLRDLFDIQKYKLYFSELKKLILADWTGVGSLFSNYNFTKKRRMNKSDFGRMMDLLNDGRINADHYGIDNLDDRDYERERIDSKERDNFKFAFNSMSEILKKVI